MRLGEFEPPSMNPYLKLNLSIKRSPAHRDLATLAAMEPSVGYCSGLTFFLTGM
ncbi:hypothetical protein DPMN_146040 [Dreissena polymorpha]|uniref:Uncharacterized protein n=1 Tax=Dreissena polymorpha TaxID=45954 RepID=A0A9D4J1M0_DREPO|nr:hypothetical protein DPMN_146040 [Dreissena polymorpha]